MATYESMQDGVEARGPRIVVVGCGGAGCNSIHRLNKIGIHGAETVAVNTDMNHLERIKADNKILIGNRITKGMGAGGLPEIGERCAELSEEDLAQVVKHADMTFVIAGMGGGTGTGVAPFMAHLARKNGSIVIGIGTTPFKAERGMRARVAMQGLERFRKNADSVIVLENDRLLKIVPTLPVDQAFSVMDQLISEVIKGVAEAITMPSLINLDFADVKTVVKSGGASTIMYGESSAEDPDAVVADALSNPFMEVDYSHAKGALIHIASGPSVSIRTVYDVVDGITSQFSENAHIIFGVRNEEREYDGLMKVITIITGARSQSLLSPTDCYWKGGSEAFDAFDGIIPSIN